MIITFVRHGERGGGPDPALTAEGRRMVAEAGGWMTGLPTPPTRVLHTATRRTRESAQVLAQVLGVDLLEEVPDVPELREDWDEFVKPLHRAGPASHVAVVGHHPTTAMLLRSYGPPPQPVRGDHFASALRLEGEGQRWLLTRVWPGRAL